jgi:CDP-diacylglycerol--glycerol-3-phosphate 3-phosphatidyltransferase
MTLANKITIARILMVPVFVIELLNYTGGGGEVHRWVALGVFLLAAIGDGVDGFVARRFQQKTELGALLDPLADKLLLVLGLVILTLDNRARLDQIPLWLTATVLARDVCLVLLMVLVGAMSNAARVRPHWTGKVATVLQMSCVVWALLKWDPTWLFWLAVTATVFTALSGLIYLPAGLAMMRAKAPAGGPPRI